MKDGTAPWPGRRGTTSTRDGNRTLVYSLLRRFGPVARRDLAEWTALTKPTITVIVDELLYAGLLEEVGTAPSAAGGGRRPRLLSIRADSHFVGGVHVGVQRTTVALADPLGNELGATAFKTRRRSPEVTLSDAAVALEGLLAERSIPQERLVAVGVTVPGLVDTSTGECELAPNLRWTSVPIRRILEDRLTSLVFVHNTAQAIAAAEAVEGERNSEQDLVVLYVGTGVGAGVLVGGQLFHGRQGFAGEIGHCTVPEATDRCTCGKRGCLETVVSAPALVRRARRELAAGASSTLSGRRSLTTRAIAAAALEGDDLARRVLTEGGEQLGAAASWLVNLFNPAGLVIAGGVSEIGEPILAPLRAKLVEMALPQVTRDLVVRRSSLGERSKIRGAVLLALQALDETPHSIFQGIGGARVPHPDAAAGRGSEHADERKRTSGQALPA